MKSKAFVFLMGVSLLNQALAYDAETHGFITYNGYLESVLAQSGATSTIHQLGVDRLDVPLPFHVYWSSQQPIAQSPDSYIDAAVLRQPNEYERCQLQNLLKAKGISAQDPMVVGGLVVDFPIQNWLLRGALREDDLTPSGYIIAHDDCGEPEPDPNGPINRVMNHFYDPINDVALTPPLVTCGATAPNGVCSKSVDWALGYVNSFATPPMIDTSRRNHFTYEDARQNMWFALTGQVNRPGGSNTETDAQRETDAIDRYFGWATSFRSLGDTIHLMEDGAQPQHVRNDPHGPILTSGEQQAFEGYTNARVLNIAGKANSYVQEFFALPNSLSLPSISAGTYPVVAFSTPLRFFTTRLGTDSTNPTMVNADSRYGLLDYTNRGFFTGGTLPGSTGVDFVEPSPTIDSSYTSVPQPCVAGASLAGSVTHLTCTHLTHAVPDNVDSGYVDALPQGFSQPPLLLQSAWSQVLPGSMIARPHSGYMIGVEEFQTQANLAIPRAIGYSAGMLNYFFRGQLAVTAPTEQIVAVLNQGAQHTMNAQGYPCVGTATNDGCAIFGFQTIRVNVRNTTPSITESGTGTVVPQSMIATTAGTPDFSNPNSGNAYLVAVARYHRNACYKPDLSGEPTQVYAAPPSVGTITQPSCGTATTRTPYQEISVSQSVAVSAAALNSASPTEVQFNFSSDPIPVNATDLFIQVVYRGPLGQEQDGIAVGTLDVREPTFVGFWDNTDYFWNGSNWLHENSLYPNESARDFWVCAGGAPVKLVYEYQGATGSPAMIDPIAGSNVPGMVRLGFVFPPPNFTGQLKNVQGTPVIYPGIPGTTQIPTELAPGMSGQIHQASQENLSASVLATPIATCQKSLPSAPYWCDSQIQQRRGQRMGVSPQPLYIGPAGTAGSASDVDSVPLPTFAGLTVLASGTVHFDTDATLLSCPAQP